MNLRITQVDVKVIAHLDLWNILVPCLSIPTSNILLHPKPLQVTDTITLITIPDPTEPHSMPREIHAANTINTIITLTDSARRSEGLYPMVIIILEALRRRHVMDTGMILCVFHPRHAEIMTKVTLTTVRCAVN